MLSTIIIKELKSIISSPKFTATFTVCSILILLSVWVGIRDYQTGIDRVHTSTRINEETMKIDVSWEKIHTQAFRQPDPMQIFVSGINNDIGCLSDIQGDSQVKLKNSLYSDDPIFAVFRFVDFAFIVQIVLSLLAIMFTYDAVNGEREDGTLQLTFSNPVPRAYFILGKFIGSWLGLTVPLLIPILLAVLLIISMGVPMTSLHWQKLFGLFGISMLFFTFFIILGLATSTLTRNSAASFLVSLVIWVFFVFIIPKVSVMAAGQLVNVSSVADTESKLYTFTREKMKLLRKESMKIVDQAFSKYLAKAKTKEEIKAAYNKGGEEFSTNLSKVRRQMQIELTDYAYRLNEERRNQQSQQEQLAFTLSRFSPATSFYLAAMNLAETDVGLKKRTEDAMNEYRDMILNLSLKKTKEMDRVLGFGETTTIGINKKKNNDGTTTVWVENPEKQTLDPAEIPIYIQKSLDFHQTGLKTIVDAGLLAIYSLIAFLLSFIAFLRYDVR